MKFGYTFVYVEAVEEPLYLAAFGFEIRVLHESGMLVLGETTLLGEESR